MEKNDFVKEPDNYSKKRYYIIMLSIPVIFFLFIELLLRIIGFGHNYDVFTSSGDFNKDMIYLNPELAFKYFDNIEYSNINPDGFYKEKKEGTFRIFVLGESSAAGFPYNSNCSFPAQLKRKLDLLYPDKTFEVINLGASAINSYTMADIFPEVLKQKPDLILIYAGHNEYYGALGVASSSSVGSGRWFVNFMLGLREFKTVELLRNAITGIKGLFASKSGIANEPVNIGGFRINTSNLMEEMVRNAYIPLNSDIYNDGIEQFEANMSIILEQANEAGVPVIIGTLVSNLKDQKPFVADNPDQLNNALAKYNEASKVLQSGDSIKAKKLFTEAKDLDGVRFRAPEKINEIIKTLATKFKAYYADINETFNSHSPFGIVGNNLICDHLHPNFYGYSLMAGEYLNVILENNLISGVDKSIELASVNRIINERYPFTEYESLYSEIIIKVLTGSYPYVEKGTPNNFLKSIKIRNYLDTAVLKYRSGARPTIAAWHLEQKHVKSFIDEMYNIVSSAPFDEKPYEITLKILKASGLYNASLPFIYEVLSNSKPNESINKWKSLVAIEINELNKKQANELPLKKDDESYSHYLTAKAKISENNLQAAIAELDIAIKLNKDFYQAYNDKALLIIQLNNDMDNALKLFNKALALKPDYEESLLNRGYLFYLQKKYKQAMLDIQTAIAKNQSNGRLYYTRGLIYFETGESKLACNDWKLALELGFEQAKNQLLEKCK